MPLRLPMVPAPLHIFASSVARASTIPTSTDEARASAVGRRQGMEVKAERVAVCPKSSACARRTPNHRMMYPPVRLTHRTVQSGDAAKHNSAEISQARLLLHEPVCHGNA